MKKHSRSWGKWRWVIAAVVVGCFIFGWLYVWTILSTIGSGALPHFRTDRLTGACDYYPAWDRIEPWWYRYDCDSIQKKIVAMNSSPVAESLRKSCAERCHDQHPCTAFAGMSGAEKDVPCTALLTTTMADGAPALPPGKRAYLLAVKDTAVSKLILPGVFIDILIVPHHYPSQSASSQPLLKRILVVAVNVGMKENTSRSYLTLAVDPAEAQVLVQAQTRGDLKILRAERFFEPGPKTPQDAAFNQVQ